jgi:predicted ATP-dependent serine protease
MTEVLVIFCSEADDTLEQTTLTVGRISEHREVRSIQNYTETSKEVFILTFKRKYLTDQHITVKPATEHAIKPVQFICKKSFFRDKR